MTASFDTAAQDRATAERRRRRTALSVVGVVFGMAGLAFASVPLYRMFCQITGFGGTPQRVEAAVGAPAEAIDRFVTIRLNSDVNPGLPWTFHAVENSVRVRVGENALVFYRATNLSSEPVSGQATYNVTPHKAGAYFDKMQCFCFEEQTLKPGQSVEMPVSFFVDPKIVGDRNMDDVKTITLSYSFFRSKTQTEKPLASSTQPTPQAPNL